MSIYDFVKAEPMAAYWEDMEADKAPYFGETIFPNDQKLGLDLSWLKGSSGVPIELKLSAFDVQAVPRERIKLDRMDAEMPFYKESMTVLEKDRQELNKMIETGNQAWIDAVVNKIFDDQTVLIEAAAVSRERMRMMLLTTGTIIFSNNGQTAEYDYGLSDDQKVDAATPWSDPDADILEDLRTWQDDAETRTGTKPTRAIISKKTWNYIRKNKTINRTIYTMGDGNVAVRTADINNLLSEELGIEFIIYSKKYQTQQKETKSYIPDDTVILIPEGMLGKTWFGTTPEESDLQGSAVVENVAIVDTGVAVTTMKKADPVNVETKVTQIVLPSFEAGDQLVIADVA